MLVKFPSDFKPLPNHTGVLLDPSVVTTGWTRFHERYRLVLVEGNFYLTPLTV